MKINRLLEITILLINRGTITARELADRFEVSTRTIYRDIDVLSGTGVPVYTNKGNKGGICLLENFALNKAIINEYESDSLMLALKTLQATKYPQLCGKSFRSVEPMQLIFKGQAWYLWGYCSIKNDFRTFRISRIKNLIVTDRIFESRSAENNNNNATANDIIHLTNYKLRFLPEILHRVYDDFDEELIKRNADGTCDVALSMTEDEWVYGYILSFGSYVEVLEPEHMREIIYSRLKKTMEFYCKG